VAARAIGVLAVVQRDSLGIPKDLTEHKGTESSRHDALDSPPPKRHLGMGWRGPHGIDVLRTTGPATCRCSALISLLRCEASTPAILQRALRHCFCTASSNSLDLDEVCSGRIRR